MLTRPTEERPSIRTPARSSNHTLREVHHDLVHDRRRHLRQPAMRGASIVRDWPVGSRRQLRRTPAAPRRLRRGHHHAARQEARRQPEARPPARGRRPVARNRAGRVRDRRRQPGRHHALQVRGHQGTTGKTRPRRPCRRQGVRPLETKQKRSKCLKQQ